MKIILTVFSLVVCSFLFSQDYIEIQGISGQGKSKQEIIIRDSNGEITETEYTTLAQASKEYISKGYKFVQAYTGMWTPTKLHVTWLFVKVN